MHEMLQPLSPMRQDLLRRLSSKRLSQMWPAYRKRAVCAHRRNTDTRDYGFGHKEGLRLRIGRKARNMWKGTVISIHIAQAGAGPMVLINEVRAVAGKGLEGDRYFKKVGTYSNNPGLGRDLTLIEMEAIEALKRDYGMELSPRDSRRNIATRGVPLNHLVGQEFKVGEVMLRGIRLCEPCSHLEKLSVKGAQRGLIHRGGLRAEILTDGVIRIGDSICPTPVG